MKEKICETGRGLKQSLLIKMFLGLVEMTFGIEYASFSLPEWQALKMTLFAPCMDIPFSVNGKVL